MVFFQRGIGIFWGSSSHCCIFAMACAWALCQTVALRSASCRTQACTSTCAKYRSLHASRILCSSGRVSAKAVADTQSKNKTAWAWLGWVGMVAFLFDVEAVVAPDRQPEKGGAMRFQAAFGLIGQFQQPAVAIAVLSVFVGVAQRVDDDAAVVLHDVYGVVGVPRNPVVKAR